MLSQTRVKDLETFVELGGYEGQFQDTDEVPMTVLIPAFVTSELKNGISDWFYVVYSFSDTRPGCGIHPHGNGYDDVIAHDCVIAF